jgi:hypothetical protein
MSHIRFPRFASHAASGRRPLSDEQLRQVAPSAFATGKHESRSARYTYIPTSAVIDGLRANGFEPTFAKQGRSRIAGKADFTKHLLRFRYRGEAGAARKVGDVFPEVVLVNSHDGTSAYQLMAGTFRLVCLNGMVVADRDLATIKVPHKGDVVSEVIEGSYTVLRESVRAVEQADTWAGVTLSGEERFAMAESAHVLRFGAGEPGEAATPIRPEQLLAARRHEDTARDLWTTTNVLQENAIRGGLTAMGRDANNRPRRVTSRPVNGIDQDVRLNRALWLLGERMAQLKGAVAA